MERVATLITATILTLFLFSQLAQAETKPDNAPSAMAQIADAMKAAPKSITTHATFKDMDGQVLREGTNGWTCYPGPALDNGKDSMCLDAVWDELLLAWKNKTEFSTDRLGIGYMFGGDGKGFSNIDPYAKEPTDDNQWIAEGPHIMVVVPNKAMLEGMPTDPENGGPYVMWKDTSLAHIMIPLGKNQ